MHRLVYLTALFVSLALPSGAATLTRSPIAEATWVLWGRAGLYGGLDTRQGMRAVVVFDLSGINPSDITSLSLSVVPVSEGSSPLRIEAIGLSSGAALDPFVWTPTAWNDRNVHTYEGEAGPCFASPATCPAVALGGFGIGRTLGDFTPNVLDVSAAQSVLAAGAFLQLSLLGGSDYLSPTEPTPPWNGTQLGHSGFADARLAPPVLTIEVIPEPGTALLLGVGLVALAAHRPR